MRKILQPIRFILSILNILAFLLTMSVVWLLVRERWSRVRWSNRLLTYFCRFALLVLNIKVNPIGLQNIPKRNALYVGNHLSYIDILMISSFVPVCFVTSMEIKNTPGLGLICQMAGCLFVERRNKMNIHAEVADLRDGLLNDLNVAIFPESTSTNGEGVLRFRRPLYTAAVDAEVPIVPFCLNYQSVGDKPLSLATRDQLFWYGDMDFGPHYWALAGAGGAKANLHFLEPVHVTKADDTKLIAEQTQRMVEAVFVPVKNSEGPSAGPSSEARS